MWPWARSNLWISGASLNALTSLMHAQGDFSKQKALCLDICVSKYLETNVQVGENMQSLGQSGQLYRKLSSDMNQSGAWTWMSWVRPSFLLGYSFIPLRGRVSDSSFATFGSRLWRFRVLSFGTKCDHMFLQSQCFFESRSSSSRFDGTNRSFEIHLKGFWKRVCKTRIFWWNIYGPMWVLICGLLRFSSVSRNSTGSSILTPKKVIFFECLLLSGLLNANVRCDVWTFEFRKSLTVIVKTPCVVHTREIEHAFLFK